MRKTILVTLLFAVSAPAFAAAPGSAQNFLDRANRLKAKGPLAIFDSDYGWLKAEATAVGKSIGDDRIAAEKRAGRSSTARLAPALSSAASSSSTGFPQSRPNRERA